MNADKHGLKSEDVTGEIISSAFAVLNTIGHGLWEKNYENALAIESRFRKIPFTQQERFSVSYRGERVGEYIPDLIVKNEIIVETKVIERITAHEMGQIMNYLKLTNLEVGLILNFKRAKLEWKRVVN